MKKKIARAPGKCILFGEHAVVYNYPAIVGAIDLYSTCSIEIVDTGLFTLNLLNSKQIFKGNSPDFLPKDLKNQQGNTLVINSGPSL